MVARLRVPELYNTVLHTSQGAELPCLTIAPLLMLQECTFIVLAKESDLDQQITPENALALSMLFCISTVTPTLGMIGVDVNFLLEGWVLA